MHTPGPWTFDASREFDDTLPIFVGECVIACAWPMGAGECASGCAESVANANLIASAPDMLAALEALTAIMPTNWADADDPEQAAAWQLAVDAIAKAKGVAPCPSNQ